MTTIAHGTNGRIYFVEDNRVATLATCTWLVLVPTYDPEPACYADTVKEVDCGARLVRLDETGWECVDGHHHYTYGTAAQQAEELDQWAVETQEV